MAEIILETPRLILRTYDPSDMDAYLRNLNTRRVMEHLGGPKERHEIEAKMAKNAACRAQHGYSFMIVQHKISGDVIGNCGLKQVDNPLASMLGDMEIGWLIAEDYWRQGLAHEAASACLDLAFFTAERPPCCRADQ